MLFRSRLALAAEPTLVFPNQREAEALVGNEFQTDEDFQHALSAIEAMGAHGVVITLKTGCYALLAAGKTKARMFRAWIPRIEAVSTVGSGDAFLAGFLSAHQAGQAADQCLKMGLACGAANTQTVGAGVFESREVPRFALLLRPPIDDRHRAVVLPGDSNLRHRRQSSTLEGGTAPVLK